MPDTPVYGLPFEVLGEEPGHSLHGGSLGGNDILAEAVEDQLARIDGDITAQGDRVGDIESGATMVGWVPIHRGQNVGANFSIDLTNGGKFAPGIFPIIELFMRFDLDTTGYVSCRVNAVSSSVYTTGSVIRGADGTTIDTRYSGSFSRWHIGRGATPSNNNLRATFFHMDGTALHSYQSTSQRPNTGGAPGHSSGRHWGSITSNPDASPSSLFIFADSGANEIVNSWWWVVGLRFPP